MKTVGALVLWIISTNLVVAQYESFGAGIAGDTVKIWNLNITSSCNTKYAATVSYVRDSIVVVETDTSTRHATCECYFDVRASVTGLPMGNYQVVIYRQQLMQYQYSRDTLIFVGSTSVDVPLSGSVLPAIIAKVFASDCHQTPISLVNELPITNGYALLTSYPNPFNPKATIHFSIPEMETVNVDMYDVNGRIVARLVAGKKAAGHYDVEFDGSQLVSGVYICRLVAGSIVLTNKLVLLK